MAEVKLHGFWCSPFTYRVIWALKVKGIDYDYIEEDLHPNNKSQQLLLHNPIYKKVPVLVHAGKPIVESLVILEYIEETWPEIPLLPGDAHRKAVARFWMHYASHKMGPAINAIFGSNSEEEKEKAAKGILEVLKILEEKGLGDSKPFFGGETINSVDITYGALAYWLQAIEEAIGIKVFEATNLPRLSSWAKKFIQIPSIKQNLPNYDHLLAYIKLRLASK